VKGFHEEGLGEDVDAHVRGEDGGNAEGAGGLNSAEHHKAEVVKVDNIDLMVRKNFGDG